MNIYMTPRGGVLERRGVGGRQERKDQMKRAGKERLRAGEKDGRGRNRKLKQIKSRKKTHEDW